MQNNQIIHHVRANKKLFKEKSLIYEEKMFYEGGRNSDRIKINNQELKSSAIIMNNIA